MHRDPVRNYYRERIQKELTDRTAPTDGAVEFDVHRRMIERDLPAGARVLVIGDAEGRYALWLAGRGCRVVLADISADALAGAGARIEAAGGDAAIEGIVRADVRDLSAWSDGLFDAVLCMGPFSHLPDIDDRERAAGEIARVLRPDGIAFIAFTTHYAVLRRMLAMKEERPGRPPQESAAPSGAVPAASAVSARLYGARPEEVAPFFEKFGFASLGLFASEGIATGIQDELAKLAQDDPEAYRQALDMVVESAGDPSILGMSGHLLYVGRYGKGVGKAAAMSPEPVAAAIAESTPMMNAIPAAMASSVAGPLVTASDMTATRAEIQDAPPVIISPVSAAATAEDEPEGYGAIELKRVYNRNLLKALGISVALHAVIIGFYAFGGDETATRDKIVLNDLPAPRSDTNWSIPVTLSQPQGGGGAPDVDEPIGRSSKGHQQATPDKTHDTPDKNRSVIVKNPDKIRLVEKEPAPVKVAGNTRDTSRQTNVVGTKGQNMSGVGDKPAGGSGGPGVGVGVGSAEGMGTRGWQIRPRATYPGGVSASGTVTVKLRFTVLPNGDVTNITPVKRADQELVNAAIAGLRRAKAKPLQDKDPQIAQTATILFTFELR